MCARARWQSHIRSDCKQGPCVGRGATQHHTTGATHLRTGRKMLALVRCCATNRGATSVVIGISCLPIHTKTLRVIDPGGGSCTERQSGCSAVKTTHSLVKAGCNVQAWGICTALGKGTTCGAQKPHTTLLSGTRLYQKRSSTDGRTQPAVAQAATVQFSQASWQTSKWAPWQKPAVVVAGDGAPNL